jgi:hypothetical protein
MCRREKKRLAKTMYAEIYASFAERLQKGVLVVVLTIKLIIFYMSFFWN